MSNVIRLDVPNDRIVAHAIGAGYGESAILVVGSRLIVGFDCCDALVRPCLRGPSYIERLLSRHSEPYVIWVLTHFHWDHFQSFTTLLDQIGTRLKKIVVPKDYTSADLAHLSKETRVEGGLQELHRAKAEYARLQRRLESPSLSRLVSTLSGPGSLFSMALRLPTGRLVPVDAELFGPNYQVARGAERTAVKEFEKGEEKRTEVNHTSYITRVHAGRFDSLFLGDAPAVRTIDHSPHCNDEVSLFLLKVAHHGAEDGTNADLLASIGNQAEKRVAMVCPFKAHGLPKESVLTLLTDAKFKYKVCGPQRPSQRLKELILSRADLATNQTTLEVYPHESNARIVRGRL